MNDKSALASDRKVFHEQKISFAEISGQTKLFIDYQNNADCIGEFYPSKSKPLRDFAAEVLANYKTDRTRLCDILLNENKSYRVGQKTLENIERLRGNNCLAVMTGQQAGLFSGSIYSIYKALSAIKLAEELSLNGTNAVPIFWIASEDHDFDEISKTFFLDQKENLFEIKNSPEETKDNLPVGFIKIENNIQNTLDDLFKNLTRTEFSQNVKDLLTETYKSGETYSSAFGKLLARLFKDSGLIFVSPLNEDLRKLCSPIYETAIKNSQKIAAELLIRNDELKKQNYHSQVLVEEDFYPFFYIDKDNQRKALRFDKLTSKVKSVDTKVEFTESELIELANKSPQSLSPNALMRPIVQDYLFPTICYYGGGAEIAYFGQNSVIYNALNRPNTPIRHRSSFTILQSKHRRTLEKYNLEFKDLFRGTEQVLAEIIEEHINTKTSGIFTETEEIINAQLKRLDQHLREDEPTLSDNLTNRRNKIIWHIDALRKKFHRAEIIKNEVVDRRIEGLFASVLPKDVLQERNLNLLYFVNLYGENFIDWIYNAVDPNEIDHQIIIF